MATQVQFFEVNGTFTYKDNPPNAYTKVYRKEILYEKESNDSGSFVPGKYRINPYLVSREKYEGNYYQKSEYSSSSTSIAIEESGMPWTGPLGNVKLTIPTLDLTWAKQYALQKAYSKLNQASYQCGVELGEIRETLEFLHHPFKQLRNTCSELNWMVRKRQLLQFLRTGRYGNLTGRKAAEAAASAWMEARYALRPLMGSISDIAALVEKGFEAFDPTKILSHRATQSFADLTVNFKKQLSFNPSSYTKCLVDLDLSRKGKATASVQYVRTMQQGVMEALGLSLPHLPEIAWELTRLSFVVDWFYGIGPWLASYRVKPGIQLLGNTVGLKTTDELYSTRLTGDNIWRKAYSTPLDGKGTYTRTRYQRTCNFSLPSLPIFISGRNMDLAKTIDLLIIAYQNVKF